MGKGRPPLPTKMLKANGSYEPGKHGNRLEVQGRP